MVVGVVVALVQLLPAAAAVVVVLCFVVAAFAVGVEEVSIIKGHRVRLERRVYTSQFDDDA